MTEQTVRRLERRAKAIDILGGVCVHCGATDKLDFDHINRDREDLTHLVKHLLLGRWSNVIKELEKYQLLCKHCHGIKSQKERGHNTGLIHGTMLAYKHYKCRCFDCRKIWNKYWANYKRSRRVVSLNS